jgi:hypothetical protein
MHCLTANTELAGTERVEKDKKEEKIADILWLVSYF